jgi:peptidoglycan/LPS O-acetylase OafA/YrhL
VLDHYRKPRVLGLDLLRIFASLSIITFHGNVARLFGRNVVSSAIAANGFLAVDIFLVLSGWLLTRQVLRMRPVFPSRIQLAVRFWTRRWARTIPPYWLVLLGMLVFGKALHSDITLQPLTPGLLLTHAFFLQTIFPPNAYGITWSLVTEEWFYLLLPFVVIVLSARARSWRVLAGVGLAILLVPATLRAILLTTPMNWRIGILVFPPARFEGLVVGALLAAASMGAPWWDRVMARRGRLFLLGTVLIAGILLAGIADTWVYRVIGILGFNLSLGLLMPFLSQLRWPKTAPVVAVMATAYLSELTYPLYLLHVFRLHLGPTSGVTAVGSGVVSVVTLLLAATLLHLGVERPCLALRDRFDRERARRTETGPAPGATWKEPAPGARPKVMRGGQQQVGPTAPARAVGVARGTTDHAAGIPPSGAGQPADGPPPGALSGPVPPAATPRPA